MVPLLYMTSSVGKTPLYRSNLAGVISPASLKHIEQKFSNFYCFIVAEAVEPVIYIYYLVEIPITMYVMF